MILPEECPALVAGDRPIVEADLGKDPAHSALALVPVTRHLDCFSKDSETLLINLNCCWTKSSLMGSWQPTKISGSTEQGYGGCKGTRKPQCRGGSLWGVGDEAALESLHWRGGWVAFRDQWKGECRKVIGVNAIHDITTRMAYICIWFTLASLNHKLLPEPSISYALGSPWHSSEAMSSSSYWERLPIVNPAKWEWKEVIISVRIRLGGSCVSWAISSFTLILQTE